MASDLKIQAIITAQDEASKVFKQVGGAVNELQGNLLKSMQTVGKWGAAITGTMVAAGGAVISAATDFETQMSNINTLLGDNQEHFNFLSQEIKDFSRDSGKAITELTSSMYDIVSAGVSQENQMTALVSAEKLSVAGLGTVKEATDLVTSSMNAFGVDSATAANTVFEAVKGGKTTVAGLAQGFGQVAGAAKEMGVSFEEFLAMNAAGTTTGKASSVVWTEQKAILTALLKPTKEMSDLYKRLGAKDGKDLIQTSGSVVGALERLREATNGNDETFAKALSSSEGLGLALQILGGSSEAYESILASMTDGVNSIDEAYEKQSKTVKSLSQNLVNNLNASMIDLGNIILPTVADALKSVSAAVGSLSTWISSLGSEQQAWIMNIGKAVLALGGLLTAMGAVGFVIPALTAGFTAVATIFAAIISPIGLVVSGIAGLTAGIIWLYQNNEQARNIINGAWQTIQATVQTVVNSVVGFFTNFNAHIETVKQAVSGMVESAKIKLQEFWATWGSVIVGVGGAITACSFLSLLLWGFNSPSAWRK